jgi:penicillin amidase
VSLLRLAFRLLLGRRLPVTTGTLTVTGPQAPVRIRRDQWGIPLIDAEDDLDVAFAVGFCHGQDRAFQLEILLRVGRGTLAELVGRDALPIDRLARRIGFHCAAREQATVLSPSLHRLIEGYALGVNTGATAGSSRPPHELSLLSGRRTPWEVADTLAVGKLISLTLCANWDAELARLKVLSADGPEALAALDPSYPAWQPVTAPVGAEAGQAADRLADDLALFLAVVRPGGGSNNWVIAGSNTATGRPILANDPHLDASLPAHWYLARARTPHNGAAGATFVGTPSFLVAHNGHAAWGLTAGLIDNTDLFLEQIGPDGASVKQGDGFVPCAVREEVIAIKGEPPVTERVLVTPRGPIISPALPASADVLSLRATWLDRLPIDGLLSVHHARSFEEFRRCFTRWPSASQNMVYADVSGTIGWQLIGRAPKRRLGHGTIPLPGWAPDAGWEEDAVSFEEMPYLHNPPCGYIATANNRPLPEGTGPFLGVDFVDGYRVASIQKALAARRDWDVASTMQLQMSQQALAWDEMRDVVLGAPETTAEARQALGLLRRWDGRASADSPAAAVYELFLSEMFRRLTVAKAPKSYEAPLGQGMGPLTPYNFFSFRRTGHLVRLLKEQPAGWFARPWPEEITDVLAAVVGWLRAQYGAVQRWAWGEVRPLTMHHPLTRGPRMVSRALAAVFNLGPVPCGGDADTINQASVLPLRPHAHADNIASLRAVIDVGAWHNSRFVLPGGQSGNPLSPHSADLWPLWQRGEGVPIAFTEEEAKAATVETLELVPGPAAPHSP